MNIQEIERELIVTKEKIKDLEERVKITEDIQAIHRLQYRYINALMCTEWDDAADCFSENALIDVYLHKPVSGKSAIEKWLKEELSKTHAGKEGDVCIHPIISVDGDKAAGKWLLYMMYFYPRTGQSLFWVQGFYDMEYIREKGEWKISIMRWSERLGLPGSGPPEGLW